MEYKVVYDFADEQIRLWPILVPIIAFLLGFGVFGAGLLLRNGVRWKRRSNMMIGLLLCVLSLWCGTLVIPYNISAYQASRDAYEGKKHKILEGSVEDFKPPPKKGSALEAFVLNGVKFEYLAMDQSFYGFNQNSVHGGPIKNGLKVRLAYFTDAKGRNIILKLEILKNP